MIQSIHSPGAPAAVGPYSQAVQVGPWLFCSGQIGLNPESGQLVSSEVTDQCGQALKNLHAVLEEAGMGIQDVVQCTL